MAGKFLGCVVGEARKWVLPVSWSGEGDPLGFGWERALLVGVGVDGYLRGFGGRWCVVVWGVGWFGMGVAVLLVLGGVFFDGVR